jgi:hypothetical protein
VSKENGFLQLRRGLWEHIRDGRMSITEGLAFVYICSQADTRTGIWKGCAKSISGELGIPERTARDVLEKMEHGDYIRRFALPGRHSCYPILVHKFEITQGEHDGEQLNALESKSPAELLYFAGEQDGEHGAAQRRSENRKKRIKQEPAAKPAPPADPRHQPFVDFAYKTFEEKHKVKPSWLGKDFEHLRLLLKANASLNGEELERRWRAYLDSTEPFTSKQGDSLAYFASHCDAFSNGPIMQSKGKANGKDINDAVATTMHGYAVNSGITN